MRPADERRRARVWHWGANYRLLLVVQALLGLVTMFVGLDDSSLFRRDDPPFRSNFDVPTIFFVTLFLLALLFFGAFRGVWLPGLLARLTIWLGLALPFGGYFLGFVVWGRLIGRGEPTAMVKTFLLNMPYIAGASVLVTIVVYVLDKLVLRQPTEREPQA